MAVQMKFLLAMVMVDQTTTRKVKRGADDTSIELGVDLALPLGVALHRPHPTVLVVRSATGSAALPSTVFIGWITATKVAILLLS